MNPYRIVDAATGRDPDGLPAGYLSDCTEADGLYTLEHIVGLYCWAPVINLIRLPCNVILAKRVDGRVYLWADGHWVKKP